MKKHELSHLLKDHPDKPDSADEKSEENLMRDLQHRLLRIQQGIWHQKVRVIFVFEGFDAAGKGGIIRRITENWDPRGVRVHPIGAPSPQEQKRHYLYRFWKKLPDPGTIVIFDRSWYGRVLVEKVDKLIDKKDVERSYPEINEFEKMLTDDGICLFKFFIAISKKEQLDRFEDRLNDPYKLWKLNLDDIRARKHWDDYVKAADRMLHETDTKHAPWHLIWGNHKPSARNEVLSILCKN